MSQSSHVLQELRRAGNGSVRQLSEDEWELLQTYVRWLYRRSDGWARERWLREAGEVFVDVAQGEPLGDRLELRKQRADRYYERCGGKKINTDMAAAKRLWILCYQFVMVWEKSGANALFTQSIDPAEPE